MHHADADLRTPPSINTLTRVHKLIVRARSILAGRQVPPGTSDFEAVHSSPAEQVFLIYPVPYFRVRNPFLKEWCGLVLNALSEAMQHTENRKSYEISTGFSGAHRSLPALGLPADGHRAVWRAGGRRGQAGFYAQRGTADGLRPAGQFFTSTEMIDVVPQLELAPTEDDLLVLSNGIPATQLVGLAKYPSGTAPEEGPAPTTTVGNAAAPSSSESFSPPPGP